jgi:hypothetical protein
MAPARPGSAEWNRNRQFAQAMDQLQQEILTYGTTDPAAGQTIQPAVVPRDTGPSQADLQAQADKAAMDRQLQQQQYERETRQRAIIGTLRAAFADYGLGDLFPEIERYARQDLTEGAILLELRKTQAYKNRFPAMEALARKGRVLTEGEYIAFERNAAQLERAYGLPAGMLDNRATIGELLTNEVSGRELEERVTLAAAGAFQTSQEMRDTFQRFYGIGSGGLTAYFLDPEKALPLLNKQFVSSQIGAEAAMQDITIESRLAEELVTSGVDQARAREGFGQVRQLRGLSAGRGDVASQEQLIGASLQGQQDAAESVRRVQAARVGRFQQGGGAIASQQGVTGAGTAATR